MFATLPAYSLARFRFKGKIVFIFFLLVTQMVPPTSLVIPLFLLFKTYKLLNTYIGLVIAYTAFLTPLSVWLLSGYIQGIPKDFEEAALVDGCSRITGFFRVVLPLVVPGLVSVSTLLMLNAWGWYLYAFVLGSTENMWVVSLGLYSFIGQHEVYVENMMATAAVIALPPLVIFLLLQRYLRKGITLGGLSGV
jgi:multiple sugar transport system permease protein